MVTTRRRYGASARRSIRLSSAKSPVASIRCLSQSTGGIVPSGYISGSSWSFIYCIMTSKRLLGKISGGGVIWGLLLRTVYARFKARGNIKSNRRPFDYSLVTSESTCFLSVSIKQSAAQASCRHARNTIVSPRTIRLVRKVGTHRSPGFHGDGCRFL